MRFTTRLIGLSVVLACSTEGQDAAARQDAASGEQFDEAKAVAEIDRLTAEFKKLGDWEAQYEIIDRAMDRAWSRNGWDSEADLFARQMIREVARIPPWEFERRMDKMVEQVGDRYGFGQPQRARFRATMYREMFGLLWAHGPTIVKQSREYIGMRLRGEPFTPEAVAQWVRESEDLAEGMRERTARIIDEFGQTIDKSHRALFERDLQSFNRRMAYMDQMRESWAEGGWKPEDWGLDNDAIQLGAAQPIRPASEFSAAQQAAMGRLGIAPDAHWGYDPSSWEVYVRGFIALYQLDASQTATAESILVEVLGRAMAYMRTRAAELVEVRVNDRATDERFAPVRSLFGELKERLGRIPTAAQRDRVMRESVVAKQVRD